MSKLNTIFEPVIGSEAAGKLAASYDDITVVMSSTVKELRGVGLTPAQARRVMETVVAYRAIAASNAERVAQVRSPADVANLLMAEMSLLEREELRAVLLDTKNNVIRVVSVYSGNLNTAVVRVCEVFREAIRHNACSIIVVHNHPSGDPAPSTEDVRLTEQLVEAGKLLDIQLLDHLVIGRNHYVSMKERGLGFRY